MQRVMLNVVPSLMNLTYKERQNKLGLPSIEERSQNSGMIAAFMEMKGLKKIIDYLLA